MAHIANHETNVINQLNANPVNAVAVTNMINAYIPLKSRVVFHPIENVTCSQAGGACVDMTCPVILSKLNRDA